MEAFLEDFELLLTDILRAGLATCGPETIRKAKSLSDRAETMGLQGACALLRQLAGGLEARPHQLCKSDGDLTITICSAVRYLELLRERLTEKTIRQRWQEGENDETHET